MEFYPLKFNNLIFPLKEKNESSYACIFLFFVIYAEGSSFERNLFFSLSLSVYKFLFLQTNLYG